jgi:hypothetical protein
MSILQRPRAEINQVLRDRLEAICDAQLRNGFRHLRSNRRLPRRFTDTPLTRNRREYERIVARYKSIELPSFVPGAISPCGP